MIPAEITGLDPGTIVNLVIAMGTGLGVLGGITSARRAGKKERNRDKAELLTTVQGAAENMITTLQAEITRIRTTADADREASDAHIALLSAQIESNTRELKRLRRHIVRLHRIFRTLELPIGDDTVNAEDADLGRESDPI